MEAFQQHPQAGLVYGNLLSISQDSRPFNLQTFSPCTLPDLMSFRIIGQPAVFLRRAVLEQAGLLDLSYHYLLDHHLWLRVAQIAPIVHIPARWRLRAITPGPRTGRTHANWPKPSAWTAWMAVDPRFAALFARHRRHPAGCGTG